jgi:hypothetical protein
MDCKKSLVNKPGPLRGSLIKTQMKTELTELARAWNMYMNPKTETEFNDAERVLLKFHKKYGTIDVATIRSLIS